MVDSRLKISIVAWQQVDKNMIRITTAFLIFAGLVWGCAPGDRRPPRAADYLLIGVTSNRPPFESVNPETGEIVGFDVELVSLICQANRWRFEIVPTPFERILSDLQVGDLDIGISAITAVPEREALIQFSDPYYLTGQGLVLPRTDTVTVDLADLRGKRVGAVTGTTGAELARQAEGLLVSLHEDIGAALTVLAEGNLDAVINDQAISRELIGPHPSLRLAGFTLTSEYYGIAMRTDDTVRLRMLNDVLAGIMGGYTYERLHAKWFGYPPMDIAVPDSVQARWTSE